VEAPGNSLAAFPASAGGTLPEKNNPYLLFDIYPKI
jgi:hypothetical protein